MSSHTFNLRTRSLVNLCFWLIQIPATLCLKPIFDADAPRRKRAYAATTYLAVFTIASWIIETIWLNGSDPISINEPPRNLDWVDGASKIGPLFAGYTLNGVIYACWQSVVQVCFYFLPEALALSAF